MKIKVTFFAIGALTISVFFGCFSAQEAVNAPAGMRLVWSDEFDGQGLPDSSKWSYDLGNGCPDLCGWGNNELQHYTAFREKNARIADGKLIIEAHREPMGDMDYSSARMVTKHKGDWTYGRLDISAKLPKGVGVWPAIWMLSSNWEYGGWPHSGEIDIMEHVGYLPDSIFGTVHTEAYNGMLGTQVSGQTALKNPHAAFHVYSMEWNAEKIDFLLDNQVYHTFKNTRAGASAWPFDKDFHLILNMAVGGNWGGKMGIDTTIWPQKMLIDYVRVYQKI